MPLLDRPTPQRRKAQPNIHSCSRILFFLFFGFCFFYFFVMGCLWVYCLWCSCCVCKFLCLHVYFAVCSRIFVLFLCVFLWLSGFCVFECELVNIFLGVFFIFLRSPHFKERGLYIKFTSSRTNLFFVGYQ